MSPRLLKDIGDHARNYHEKYVRPSLIWIAEQLAKMKKLLILDYMHKIDTSSQTYLADAFTAISIPNIALAQFLKYTVI